TWKKPGDSARYQLDYILVRQRYRNSVKDSRSYPGADIDSDHNLVMAKIAVRLKKKVKSGRRIKKWKLEGIKEKAVNFHDETLKELTKCNNAKNSTMEEDWKQFKEAVKRSAEVTIGYQTAKKAKKPWVSEKMI